MTKCVVNTLINFVAPPVGNTSSSHTGVSNDSLIHSNTLRQFTSSSSPKLPQKITENVHKHKGDNSGENEPNAVEAIFLFKIILAALLMPLYIDTFKQLYTKL